MSMTLNLGEVVVPYADAKGVTTADVAGFMEAKYHLFTHFYEINQVKIADLLADSVAGALESVLMGAPAEGVSAFASAEDGIAAAFREFLTLDVMGSLGYPGVPTQAALDGVNHRFKNPKGKSKAQAAYERANFGRNVEAGNPPRPSFIDTGQMQAAMRAWVE